MREEGKLKKNMFLLIVLVMSGAFIYMLPYLRNFYYEAFIEAFNMTDTESGLCGTYFGFFGAASYLIGGLISSRVSFKILIPGSMIVTGALGLVLLLQPDPMVIAIIHGIWGITSLMTFWPALVQALRMVGNANEQGKVFGIFEGGRGVTNAIVYAAAAALFAIFYNGVNTFSGIMPIIFLYSVAPIALGILSIFLLRNIKLESKTGKGEGDVNFKIIGSILKNPRVWLLSAIMFCAYTINMSNYYIAPYATAAFGASLLAAAIISSSSQYIRPFAAIGSGILGDRINNSKVMLLGNFLALAGLIIIFVTPEKTTIIPVLIGTVAVYVAMFVTQSMHFAIMEEIDIPAEASGTVIGLCCTIGYLPEALAPLVAGQLLNMYPENSLMGYRLFFIILIIVTVIGIILTFLWLKQTKERRAELLQMRRDNMKEKVAESKTEA